MSSREVLEGLRNAVPDTYALDRAVLRLASAKVDGQTTGTLQ